MMAMPSWYVFTIRKAMAFSCAIANMLAMMYEDAFTSGKALAPGVIDN